MAFQPPYTAESIKKCIIIREDLKLTPTSSKADPFEEVDVYIDTVGRPLKFEEDREFPLYGEDLPGNDKEHPIALIFHCGVQKPSLLSLSNWGWRRRDKQADPSPSLSPINTRLAQLGLNGRPAESKSGDSSGRKWIKPKFACSSY
jgi:hypothetical protein